ncbi:MAG: hypothetical protein KME28_24490 [Pelatocladus maniniholoensis HA4357-MV3]|jgi:hypothetical protein|uniref:Uncharacterized protein n=1 Tax=Pelatocladus maniniholoensis HA4357-MV3 TaxID=1117104 RepID=A0A9E3HCR6_9NOST|nr:hypothetical protein [Pelatocladus maniniholoensis HA4357-MV3]BAZ67894.1 hypothetical protein NIES4106_26510 [Fischerella sp. NIES-4106]
MSKFKFSALISFACLMSVVLYSLIGFSQSPQPTIRLTTEPPVNQILPFEAEASSPQSPVKLKLQAVDGAGKPLEQAKINLKILTPSKNPWFTTDFPIVEGTKLLEMTANAPKGELQWQQMLPIRGKYHFQVNVTPNVANAFNPIEQTLTLSVAENWVKFRNFGILAVILLVVGFGGGWVIGGQQKIQPGEIAPERVRLLLSVAMIVAIIAMLVINLSAKVAHSHTIQHTPSISDSGIVQQGGLQAQILGDKSATVGQTATLGVKVIDQKTNQPAKDILLNIKTTQLENGWTAFSYKAIPDTTGQFTWQQQFFDGAPHKLEIEISSLTNAVRQFSPLRLEREIEVEGVAPPLITRFIALSYMTVIVIFGVLIGLGLRQNLTSQN